MMAEEIDQSLQRMVVQVIEQLACELVVARCGVAGEVIESVGSARRVLWVSVRSGQVSLSTLLPIGVGCCKAL